jgi:hypothetical protein
MQRAKSCAIVLVVIIALVAGLVGGMYLVGGRSAISPFTPGLSAPAASKPVPGEPGPIRVRFTQETLSEQLRKAVKGQEVRDLFLRLEPGLIVVTGRLQKGPLSSPFQVELVPFVQGGQVKVEVRKASVGPMPLPGELSAAIGSRAARALAREQEKIPGLVIDTVEVETGVMEVTGHLDPSHAAAAEPSDD